MTRQEKIKEGITEILARPVKVKILGNKKFGGLRKGQDERVNQILQFLDKEGVRINVPKPYFNKPNEFYDDLERLI